MQVSRHSSDGRANVSERNRFQVWAAVRHSATAALKKAGFRQRRQLPVMIENLEKRVLLSNTLLYWDANGATAGTGGTGAWNTTSLVWRNGSDTGALQAWGNADPSTTTAVFGGTAGTVTIATGTTIHANSLQVLNGLTTVTIAGADATAGLHLSGTTPTLDSGTGNLAISAIVSGSAGLIKAPTTGCVSLTGANTYTGTISIKGGTLNLGAISAAGDLTNTILVGDSGVGMDTKLNFSALVVYNANPISVQAGAGTRTIGQTGTTFTGGETVSGAITLAHDVIFTSTGSISNGTNTFSSAISGTGSVTINVTKATFSGAWTFDGTLTNSGTGTALVNTPLSTHITQITQSGTGALVIYTGNTYAGSYNVTAGTLAAGSATAFTSSNVINLGAAGTLNLKNPGGSSSTHYNITVAGLNDISGAGGTVINSGGSSNTITVGGTGTYAFSGGVNGTFIALTKSGTGTQTLSGTNTYTGATTVSAGTLNVTGSITATASAAVSGGTLDVDGSLTSPGNLTVTSTGVLTGSGTINNGNVSVTTGTVDAGNSSSGTGILSTNNLSLGSTATFRGQLNGNVAGTNYDQLNVTGTVNLGSSILSLSGTRTGTFGTSVTLINNDSTDAVVGTFAGKAEGSTVTVNGVNYTLSYVGGTGNDVVLTDTTVAPILYWDANGASAGTGGTGTWDTTSLLWRAGSATGTLQAWGNADPSNITAVFGGTAGTITIASGTTIHANVVQLTTTAQTIAAASGTAILDLSGTSPTVDTGTGTLTISAAITGTNASTKIGTGTLNLTGTSSYAATLNVNAGTLDVDGTLNGASGITVNSGGTLSGSGTINKAISVTGTGILDAGNSNSSTGQLSTNNLSLASTSTFRGQSNGNIIGDDFDQVNVTGTVNLGSATLSLSGTRTAVNGCVITLIRNDGTDAVTGTFAGLAQGATVTINGVNYTLSYTGGTGNDVTLTDATTGILTNQSIFGVSTDATRSTQFSTWAPQVGATGTQWVRGLPVKWGAIEGTQGVYNFTTSDAQLANAQANGITNLIGTMTGAPGWTGETGFPVGHLTDWSNYVTAVVNHYSSTVKYWEVWNEPPHYTTPTGNVTQYAQLVSATYTAAKAADSTAQVGLAASNLGIEWLKETIQAGAAGKYDYIVMHPYELLGTLNLNWDVQFMNMVKDVRKMLAEVDPTKVNVPIILTEIGADASDAATTTTQAQLLVKAFSMGLAQGIKNIDWFEGRDGDSGPKGLLTSAGAQRPSYVALSNMITYLGQNPQYLGWVKLNNKDWGFVFQGKTENVLVTWAPVGGTDTINFSASTTFVDPLTGTTTSGTSYSLTDTPVLVVGVPADIVATAKANKNQPLPWGADYTSATSVDFTPNNATIENGLHGKAGIYTTGYGENVYSAQSYQQMQFGVDPNFLSYDHTPITITVVARRINPGTAAWFNLKYERVGFPSGYKTPATGGTWNISSTDAWQTHTWTISDEQFAGFFGFNFMFDSDATGNSQYYVKSVTVTKTGALRAAGPASTANAPKITTATLTSALSAAKQLWYNAGASTSAFNGLTVSLSDLGQNLLGIEYGKTIVMDDNAAGYGWSTGSTVTPGKMDLQTALVHELGHFLGLTHDDAATQPVMAATLVAGVRLLPQPLTAAKASSLFSDTVIDTKKHKSSDLWQPI